MLGGALVGARRPGVYKMYLNVSGKENIIRLLQTTIRSLTQVWVVGVDLASEGGWWPIPAVEKAFAEPLPEVPGFDPAADIRRVVEVFPERLNGQEITTPAGAHVVCGFRGFLADRVLSRS